MEPKLFWELSPQEKHFIRIHTKMSTAGIAQILKVSYDRVKRFREELLTKSA